MYSTARFCASFSDSLHATFTAEQISFSVFLHLLLLFSTVYLAHQQGQINVSYRSLGVRLCSTTLGGVGCLQALVDVVVLFTGLQGRKLTQQSFESLSQLCKTRPLRGLFVPAAQHHLISERVIEEGKKEENTGMFRNFGLQTLVLG